jgi:aminoglycoside phosphotransferase family enzyme/predicted kinase
MVTEDQSEVIAFLLRPDAYGVGNPRVEHVETHSAMVFMAGDRALKLKRAVRYDYLDFSSAERRRRCCEAEVAVNRRTAPAIYRGTAVVTRESSGRLALDGMGAPVEWLVDMTRFDGEALADRLAESGTLPLTAMAPLAESVAALHAGAARRLDAGGAAGMRWVADGNRSALSGFGTAEFPDPARSRLVRDTARALDAKAARLDQRRADGFVRQCHGDLHLGNIVLLDGAPTLFDAVEFNDDISCIDVVYDLAFLLMDLWHRGLPRHANLVLNEYLHLTDDLASLALLPLFLSCRAAVRAKTNATAATLTGDAAARRRLVDAARQYLELAQGFLAPPGPVLVALGGRSGSGKSTAAAAVAPAIGATPGALHLRTDLIRKQLCGVSPLTRLPAEAYAADVTARVYARLRHAAALALATGHAVVCDGVFGEAWERQALHDLAGESGVPFVPVWLDAPEATLRARVAARRGDVSDATADVVERQAARVEPPPDWSRLDASGAADDTVGRVVEALAAAGVPAAAGVIPPAASTRPA